MEHRKNSVRPTEASLAKLYLVDLIMKNQAGVPRHPVVLIILDGFGVNPSKINNAVAQARTPRLDEYFFRYPFTVLSASGTSVGLPEGQMGNSEVGHMTLGSGCVIRQDLVLIDDAIADGSFYSNVAFNSALDRAAAASRPVHLMGLVSEGGVHSHLSHLMALIDLCGRRGIKPLVHMITDGRDTAPKSAMQGLDDLERALYAAGGRSNRLWPLFRHGSRSALGSHGARLACNGSWQGA